jgi:class 3 adenylate cyclase
MRNLRARSSAEIAGPGSPRFAPPVTRLTLQARSSVVSAGAHSARQPRWVGDSPRRRAIHPKHLAEKILTSKSALEGERKQVTVLFADLKGSMELLADRDPEEAWKILDPVLELMMEAVHRYEGR